MIPTETPYRVKLEQVRQRLYRLLELVDAGYSCRQISKMPEWSISKTRIQQLRVKALAMRGKEGTTK